MVSIKRELERTYYYFSGRGYFAPKWLRALPAFFQPMYTGDGEESHTWYWFGIRIKTEDSQVGDTLLTYWRRQRRKDRDG